MNYKNYNDYELLYLLEEEDEDASKILRKKYMPLIYDESKKYYRLLKTENVENFSFDELISIGIRSLFNAVMHYNDTKGAIFFTYFTVCLRNDFTLYRRSLYCLKNKPVFYYQEKEYEVEDVLSTFDKWRNNPLELCQTNELEEEIAQFMYDLEGVDRAIFELRYNGFKYCEIAKLLELTTNYVGKSIQRLRARLKKKLKNISI